VAPDNASITFEGSGRRLSGTSLDVMDNVGCPYGTLGLEGKRSSGYNELKNLQEISRSKGRSRIRIRESSVVIDAHDIYEASVLGRPWQ
jgi:hypothetical protein